MNTNLLILGAGQYGAVASEIADSMGCFDRIDFLDDNAPEHAVGFFLIVSICLLPTATQP